MNQPVADFVESVVLYFGRQVDASEENLAAIQGYLSQSKAGGEVRMAQERIALNLAPESCRVLEQLDPGFLYSDSRILRKLLDIFMNIAEEDASAE